MSYEQISAGIKVIIKPVYYFLLSLLIKVNHYIPAEDKIKFTFKGIFIIYKVQPAECQKVAQQRFNTIPAIDFLTLFVKVYIEKFLWYVINLFLFIDSVC